jgi:hypothetical protein
MLKRVWYYAIVVTALLTLVVAGGAAFDWH